eukprot:360105-Chlamydomonas_euryale.AAC.2
MGSTGDREERQEMKGGESEGAVASDAVASDAVLAVGQAQGSAVSDVECDLDTRGTAPSTAFGTSGTRCGAAGMGFTSNRRFNQWSFDQWKLINCRIAPYLQRRAQPYAPQVRASKPQVQLQEQRAELQDWAHRLHRHTQPNALRSELQVGVSDAHHTRVVAACRRDAVDVEAVAQLLAEQELVVRQLKPCFVRQQA